MQSSNDNRTDNEVLIHISKDAASSRRFNPLPDRILLHIFYWLVMIADDYPQPPAQYDLASVCWHWRRLVLNCPQLWKDINTPMKDPYEPFVFFERSNPLLFDLTVYSSWSPGLDVYTQISVALLRNLRRLRRLIIEVINFQEVEPIFEAWKDETAPNFRHLEICCGGSDQLDYGHTTLFNHGDSLRSLKLKGLQFQSVPTLRYLTTLEIDRLQPEPHLFQELFAQFPALETFIVGIVSAPSERTHSGSPGEEISVPSLKSLAISLDNNHAESCSCAFPRLNTENLEYLEIAHYESVFADHYVSLASHFKPSRHLRKIRIRGHLFTEADVDFLASLPKGISLEIIGFPSHRDPGAGLPIVNLVNLASITIDLTTTMSKYTSDFDKVAFHGALQNTHLAFHCPVAVCCDCEQNAVAWQSMIGNCFTIRSKPLEAGYLDNYFISSYDDLLDRFSGSSQDEYFDWHGDDDDDQYYDDYDEEDDYPYESGFESGGEDEDHL